MPLFYQHNINEVTKLAVWHITEDENFFSGTPLQRTITHPHKRLQHLAGRYLLRFLFPDFPLHLIEIADTRKPYLAGEEYHFSISHCGDYAAVIVSSTSRVGIDIEITSDKIERVKHKFLNDKELEKFNFASKQELTLLWSAKESIFKWAGAHGIDFRENMHLERIEKDHIKGSFLKQSVIDLIISYKCFDDIILTFLKH